MKKLAIKKSFIFGILLMCLAVVLISPISGDDDSLENFGFAIFGLGGTFLALAVSINATE